ncbi:AMP-binding protein [Halomarina halobia]|uniref:AMP-binding protein n=1 Tax=Halomarina halobia TaxID=3033386 RepID=A0ABD6AEA0_9EURY|nr:AMP-binding protein [Halomarina sp. PSR21]
MVADRDASYVADADAWPEGLPRTLPFPRGRRPGHECLRAQATERPNAPAVTFYGRTLTWGELDAHVDGFAAALEGRGHGLGDVCALYLQNSPQFLVAYHGAHRAGLVATPVNPQSKTPALRRQLADSGAEVIVAHTDLLTTVREATAASGPDDVIAAEYRAFADPSSSSIPVHPVVTDEPSAPGDLETVADLSATGGTPSEDGPTLGDRALLQYTGGTTGLPKGCVHTHWNVLFKATTTAAVRRYDESDVLLGAMPTFHVAGKQRYCDAPPVAGCHVVLLARYAPEAVLAAVDTYGVTSTWLAVPAVEELLSHPELDAYDLTSLSANRGFTNCSSFGTMLTRDLSDDWEAATGSILQESGYGLTETHTTDTHTFGTDRVEPGFVGLPCYGVDVEIRDVETGEALPPGERGEIVVSTPATMVEYHGRPDETAAVLDPDGALHTGDVGLVTEEGYLYFLGRRKDAIKVSGHTVAPREVELVVEACPGVADAVVVGAPHERRGAVLEAHVVPADGTVTEAEILDYVAPLLAEFKRPRRVVFRESFPRTDVGKVDRAGYYETLPDGYE